MPAGYEPLSVVRVNRVMQALQDKRVLDPNLIFLKRTPVVPAAEGEIMARWLDTTYIADIITKDAKTPLYESGRYALESSEICKLKSGTNFMEEDLFKILGMAGNNATMADQMGLGRQVVRRTLDSRLRGIRHRMEQMIVSMWIDTFNYDRAGIKILSLTFGMPSDLKVTPAIPWSTAASATPIDDIEAVKLVADQRYGQVFDRITMSTTVFRAMIATTEFQTKAKLFIPPQLGGSYSSFIMADLGRQRNMAEMILNMSIELYDARYWSRGSEGVRASVRFMPIEKVILSNSANDGNSEVMDFGNGIVLETMLSAMLPNTGTTGMIGQFPEPQRGPVGYCTVPNDLDPPGITCYGVARGFPRKHILQSTACLTVGTFTETISVSDIPIS
jgi:hypothetical protein